MPFRSLLIASFLTASVAIAGDNAMTHRTLYNDHEVYSAWPSMVRAANGDILISVITTEQHLGPDASVSIIRSTDNGQTWSEPVVAVDTILDDREGGFTVTADGEILMHVFATHWKAASYEALAPDSYPEAWIKRWIKHVSTPEYINATEIAGAFIYSSKDHGTTWQKTVHGPDSTHGGIALHDGSLLVTSYREDREAIRIYRAADSRSEWEHIHSVPSPAPQLRFGEPHVTQLPSGRIVVMIRATSRVYDDERSDLYMWSTYSDDNGETWAHPFPTPMLGFPPHLLTLSDGRLLCTYGRRAKPYGQRAMISADGVTWNHAAEITLRDDAPNHDLGYPASIELSPGRILTTYYQKPALDPDDKHRYTTALYTTEWSVPEEK